MFGFKERRIDRFVKKAEAYLKKIEEEKAAAEEIRYAISSDQDIRYSRTVEFDPDVCYSRDVTEDTSYSKGQYTHDRRDSVAYVREQPFVSLLRSPMAVDEVNARLDRMLESTFSEQLIKIVDSKGIKDSAVYRAAQIDRRLYSKIVSDRNYKPSKDTAVALCMALHLPFSEATDMLAKAGYSISHSDKRDAIIELFFKEEFYDIIEANCVLDRMGQKLIGK